MPLTKEEMEKFAKKLERNFSPPFLPGGAVKVHIYDDHFNLRIGRRDVDFNLELNDVGSGTMMTEDPFPFGEDGKIKKGQKFMKPKKRMSKKQREKVKSSMKRKRAKRSTKQ